MNAKANKLREQFIKDYLIYSELFSGTYDMVMFKRQFLLAKRLHQRYRRNVRFCGASYLNVL